jgi:hypothetical protein
MEEELAAVLDGEGCSGRGGREYLPRRPLSVVVDVDGGAVQLSPERGGGAEEEE